MRNEPDGAEGAVSAEEIRALENATGHPIGPGITPAQFRNLARIHMEHGQRDLDGGGQHGIEGYGGGNGVDA